MPSTKSELKEYARRAREKEEAKKDAKSKKTKEDKLPPIKPIKGLQSEALIAKYIKIMEKKIERYNAEKNKDKRWPPSIPKYDLNESDKKLADANFLYDVQGTLAHLSWKELQRLVEAGVPSAEKSINFTGAFHLAEQAMFQALGAEVDDTDVRYVLTDRNATLKLWPVKSKVNKVTKKEADKGSEEVKKDKKAKKNEKKSDDAPKKRGSVVEISDDTIVAFKKARPRGGPKSKLMELIPRKGITVSKLVKKAKEAELPFKKVKDWLKAFTKNGFVEVKE